MIRKSGIFGLAGGALLALAACGSGTGMTGDGGTGEVRRSGDRCGLDGHGEGELAARDAAC